MTARDARADVAGDRDGDVEDAPVGHETSGETDAPASIDTGSAGEPRDGSSMEVRLADAPDGGAGDARHPYHALGVVTGDSHTCALLDDHRVKCWGNNGYGQLGTGDVVARGGKPEQMGDALPVVELGAGRTATAIAAGGHATCAILDDGSLKCWGQAGLNGQSPERQIGDQVGQMGDNLPRLDFAGRRVTHVAVGNLVACASTDDEGLWCWGHLRVPTKVGLPTAPVRALSATSGSAFALYEDGTASPILPDGMSPVLTSTHEMVAITGGTQAATCALLDDGTITCDRPGPQEAAGGKVTAIGIEQFQNSVCALFADGSVRCPANATSGECATGKYWCGPNGTIALGAPASGITQNGYQFMCALLVAGDVKCWGSFQGDPMPREWLGAGVSLLSITNGVPTFGPWKAVDLGTRP